MTTMAETYPAYIDAFLRLESLAPADDLPPLKLMTEHEEVLIAFAEAELRGEADSDALLRAFLDKCDDHARTVVPPQ